MPKPGKRKLDPVAAIVVFTAISTILLLLSTLSTPFNKSVYLFRLGATANGIWRYVDFGVFGYCPVPIGRENNSAEWSAQYPNCTKPMLGWGIEKDVTDVLQVQSTLQSGLPKFLTSLLILGPAASVLASIAFLVSLAIYASRPTPKLGPNGMLTNLANSSWRFKAICTVAQVALSCATLTLIIDIVVLSTIQDHVSSLVPQNSNLKYSLGAVVWFDAVAWFLLLLSTLAANRLRRAAIQFETAAEPNVQITPVNTYGISDIPQPYYHALPAEQLSPPPPPRSPELHGHQNDDAPPPYTVSSDTTAAPLTSDTLVAEGGRPFNFFRSGNNAN